MHFEEFSRKESYLVYQHNHHTDMMEKALKLLDFDMYEKHENLASCYEDKIIQLHETHGNHLLYN